MTADELARGYLLRARKRMAALRVLMAEEATPDVVREPQELVEVVLEGMLRWVGIDPPRWHDVGDIVLEHAALFPPELQSELPALAAVSRRLRRERENAFYGDVDMIPDRVYGRDAATQAMADAQRVLDATRYFLGDVA
jgi:HEPN domain-containing protein